MPEYNVVPKEPKPQVKTPNRFDKMIELIKKGEKTKLLELIKNLPKVSIDDWLWKLGRNSFKRFKLTSVAMDELRKKRYPPKIEKLIKKKSDELQRKVVHKFNW
jgi:hypothetical protein